MFEISIIFYLCQESRLNQVYLKVEGREKPIVDLHEKQEANVLF